MPRTTFLTACFRRGCHAGLLAAFLLTLAGCSATRAGDGAAAGRPWKVSEARFVEFDEMVSQARAADIVLLGETHDNLEHHAIQRKVLESLADARPALVMEQFDLEQQASLDAILGSDRSRQDKLDALKALMGPGWEWPAYEGLLSTALERRLPVLAANISRTALREVARTGPAALGANASMHLGLDSGWSADQQASLRRDIQQSHCGLLPESRVDAMVYAQRVRDAIMADRLLSLQGGGVAIMGRGHARQDLAVPVYLKQRAPQRRVLSVALTELTEDAGDDLKAPPFDYVIRTGAVAGRTDPCAGFALPAGPAR